LIPQREKRPREKILNGAYQKFIRICLKESFHREKKDLEGPNQDSLGSASRAPGECGI
jgi:hypothetical protein